MLGWRGEKPNISNRIFREKSRRFEQLKEDTQGEKWLVGGSSAKQQIIGELRRAVQRL